MVTDRAKSWLQFDVVTSSAFVGTDGAAIILFIISFHHHILQYRTNGVPVLIY